MRNAPLKPIGPVSREEKWEWFPAVSSGLPPAKGIEMDQAKYFDAAKPSKSGFIFQTMAQEQHAEVIVIGGGMARLFAALYLGHTESVLLATGVQHLPPEIEGVTEYVGHGTLFLQGLRWFACPVKTNCLLWLGQ
jgi:hypothetical protein